MKKYKCSACKYAFARNFDYIGKCPYCGKDAVQLDSSVDKVVREVDEFWVKKAV